MTRALQTQVQNDMKALLTKNTSLSVISKHLEVSKEVISKYKIEAPLAEAGDLVFISGQIPLDAATGKLVDGDISAQAKQSLENLKTILAAAGLTFTHVVKTTIFLTSMGDFAAVAAIDTTAGVPEGDSFGAQR